MSFQIFLVVCSISIAGMELCAAGRTAPANIGFTHTSSRALLQSNEATEGETYDEMRSRCIDEGRNISRDVAVAACNTVNSACQAANSSADPRPRYTLLDIYGPGSVETGVDLPCDRLIEQACQFEARRYLRMSEEECEEIVTHGPIGPAPNCTDLVEANTLLYSEIASLCAQT